MHQQLQENQSVVIAVDIGATNMRVALITQKGHFLQRTIVRTVHPRMSEESLLAQIKDCIDNVYNSETYALVCIGVSVAGPLTTEKTGFRPPNLPIEKVEIVAPLNSWYGCPVVILGDTKAAVYAEWYERKMADMAYVTISSGVGCGVITDGKLLQGYGNSAGEMGHMPLADPYGESQVSDWESYVAGKGIVEFWQRWCVHHDVKNDQLIDSAKDLYEAYEKDQNVQLFLDNVSRLNARGVENIIFAYNPQVIIFGGSIAYNNWNIFIAGVRKYIRRDIVTPLPQFELTKMGDDVSLRGVAMYAWKSLK